MFNFFDKDGEDITNCEKSSCLGEPWSSAWEIVEEVSTSYNSDICDRLWENGAFGAENINIVFNLF